MTAVCYAGKDVLFTSTAQGVVCVWSITKKQCFMHWQADATEIGMNH